MDVPPASETAPRSHLDIIGDEIQSRRNEIGSMRSFVAAGQHQPQSQTLQGNGRPVSMAASKLRAYRDGNIAMRSYNRTTEQLLVSPRPPPSNNGHSSSSFSTSSNEGSRFSSAPGGGRGGGGGGSRAGTNMTSAELKAGSTVFGSRGESQGDALVRVTKINRTLQRKVEELQEEVERYKQGLSRVNGEVDDISNESMNTDQKVANLAHDLEIETQNHEAARASLQEKQRKVDQQAERLAQLEVESSDVHAKNLELSSHIHEMNLLAEQQQDQLRRQAEAAAAIAVEAVAATAGGGEEDLVGAGGGEGVGNGGYEELEEKLKAAQAMAEFKTRELGAVNARADKVSHELLVYKGVARRGMFKRFLMKVWWLIRAVGIVGFVMFAYIALSEDALRSRGVDVFRLAH